MKTIHKFTLREGEMNQRFSLPSRCRILSAQNQNGILTVWVFVDTNSSGEIPILFHVVGTGWDIEDSLDEAEYVSTVQMETGLVWHVYWGD